MLTLEDKEEIRRIVAEEHLQLPMCEHHKEIAAFTGGYNAWFEWAKKRYSQKLTQIRCEKCKRYFFPDELNEPNNPKAQKVIENHHRYLESHPKAKSRLLC